MSKPFEKRDFQSAELDSLIKIFLLTPDDPLDTFAGRSSVCQAGRKPRWLHPCAHPQLTPPLPSSVRHAEIWYQLFIWSFFSSVLIYSIAAVFAFRSLSKHKIARYSPLLLLLAGLLSALTMNILTSALIASIYRQATSLSLSRPSRCNVFTV